MSSIFKTDPGHVYDFAGRSAGDIFNEAILPTTNFLSEQADPGGLEDAARRRDVQLQKDLQQDHFQKSADDDFLKSVLESRGATPQAPSADLSAFEVPVEPPAPSAVNSADQSARIKLSNYGYSSDSSPDHNSNVLRIGHANNKLEDGVSAALTKTLAQRHNLKTGDFFEIQTSDGQKMKRRYDDTVPTTYKGKPLPETVDLYNLKGSNSFGGTVIGIRKI